MFGTIFLSASSNITTLSLLNQDSIISNNSLAVGRDVFGSNHVISSSFLNRSQLVNYEFTWLKILLE